MHRRPKKSRWQRFLRCLMPAQGAHARADETGELPVLGKDSPSRREPPPDPRATRADYSIEHYYRNNIPAPRQPPRARPYVKAA